MHAWLCRSLSHAHYPVPPLFVFSPPATPLLLQLFYKMETSEDAVTTRDLTESFGWTDAQSFQQHDLQACALPRIVPCTVGSPLWRSAAHLPTPPTCPCAPC